MPVEFLQSNIEVAYPFTQPGDVLLASGKPFSHAVADLSVLSRVSGPITLSLLSNPAESNVRIHLTHAGSTVYDSSAGVVTEFGAWVTIAWPEASIILSAAALGLISWPVEPNLEIVPTCVNRTPRTVNKFTINAGDGATFDTTQLEIHEGYNLGIAQTAKSLPARSVRSLTLSAYGGAGRGVWSDCSTPAEVLTLNSVKPDARGNIELTAENCYRIGPQLSQELSVGVRQVEIGKLSIGNDCAPCCGCEDYGDVYSAMRVAGDRATAAADQLYAALHRYEDIVAALKSKTGTAGVFEASLTVAATAGWLMTVQLAIRNNTETASGPCEVVFATAAADMSVVPAGSAYIFYSSGAREEVVASEAPISIPTIANVPAYSYAYVVIPLYVEEATSRVAGAQITLLADVITESQIVSAVGSCLLVAPFNKE